MINGNMTISYALQYGISQLSENKSIETPRLDTEVLLCHILKCDRVFLVVNKDKAVSDREKTLFVEYIKRRKTNEPVSYITGVREFMSLDFEVTEGILIPRPDTEILVEKLIEIYKNKSPEILDLCTGSGAIAISLLYYLNDALCTAVDKYDICVETAIKNAVKHNVDGRLDVIKSDVLNDFKCDKDFDCIVSNPPYIETDTLEGLSSDVKDYEPIYALDGGSDGLIFYRTITGYASKNLKSGGILAFEIGYNQGESVKKIIKDTECFVCIDVIPDLSGLDRVVIAEKR